MKTGGQFFCPEKEMYEVLKKTIEEMQTQGGPEQTKQDPQQWWEQAQFNEASQESDR